MANCSAFLKEKRKKFEFRYWNIVIDSKFCVLSLYVYIYTSEET